MEKEGLGEQMRVESFALPVAIGNMADIPAAIAMMERVEKRVASLRVHKAYLGLRELLSERYPMITSFIYEINDAWMGEGYETVVAMTIDYLDEHGEPQVAECDQEHGTGEFKPKDGRFKELRTHIEKMQRTHQDALSCLDIDCRAESSLAVALMGEEGYAEFEAEQIARAAGPGACGSPARRI